MSNTPGHIDFRSNVQHVPPHMPASVQKATKRFLGNRGALVQQFGPDNWENLRQAGHEIRLQAIRYLDHYLIELETQVTAAGGYVHWARDAAEARELVVRIAREHNVRRVVKAKSMASEEINLNHALQEAGIQALETDLGEYIVQLAGEMPSHIIVPAVHLTKEGIADLFHDKLGVTAPADPTALTALARTRLREEFLAGDMGITGANFMVAETGTIVLVTNEGNGRMCTTLPPVHVAIAGIDKVVPDLQSLSVLLKLLARSATGQKISTYTSFIRGPRHADGENGPQEFHLILLDNGRTRILQDENARETMLCIRCGACLNVCPVYNNVGGHAYGWVYSGPIGSILSPQLLGSAVAADLPFASSLCGACAEVCPVKIPIPKILLHLRHRVVEGDQVERPVASPVIQAGVTAGTLALGTPWLYETGSQLLQVFEKPLQRGAWLPHLPPPLDRWTMVRPFPAFDATFRSWWRSHSGQKRTPRWMRNLALAAIAIEALLGIGWLLMRKHNRPVWH
jgi:L-lactate dehydrogenase complex protein LldF